MWVCVFMLGAGEHRVAVADGLATPAEYIVGFVRYVHWKGEDEATPWRVCIVGASQSPDDPTYANEIVRGKRFAVTHIAAEDDITVCQVLDLTAIDNPQAAKILLRSHALPILSVGAGSEFCSEGGLACLNLRDPDQKFEINLSAVKKSGLEISARLLMLGSGRAANKGSP